MRIPGLGEKNKWTNFWGNVMMLVVTGLAVHAYFKERISVLALVFCGGYVVAYFLFMMPEKIKAVFGKVSLEIEDTEDSEGE